MNRNFFSRPYIRSEYGDTHSFVVGDTDGSSLNGVEAYGGSGCKIKWSNSFSDSYARYTTWNALLNAEGGYITVYRYKNLTNSSSVSTVTITLNANGGSCSQSSVKVSKGSAIGTLPTPTRSGYRFVGWFEGKYYSNAIQTYTTTNSDTTFYAHWAKESDGIQVKFNPSSTSNVGSSASLTDINGERTAGALMIYDWSGVEINTNEWGVEVAVDANGKVTQIRSYASSTKLTVPTGGFVLSGNDAGADFVSQISVGDYVGFSYSSKKVTIYKTQQAYLTNHKYVTYGAKYGTLPTPTKSGYTLKGWYTAASGGTAVTSTTTVTKTAAHTLYAQWECTHKTFCSTESYTATCKHPAYSVFTCLTCGYSYTTYPETGWSDWSTTNPAGTGLDEHAYQSRTEYRYQTKKYTTSSSSTLSGWTYYGKGTKYSSWGSWSSWSTTAVTETNTVDVETTPLYRYYYYLCSKCGDHNPLYGSCGCGGSSTEWHEVWSTIAYSSSSSSVVSYATSKRVTTSLGDGAQWYFSAGNLNSTSVGTTDSDSSSTVISQGYRYRTRTASTYYKFWQWGDWSDWSTTEVTATDTKNVETRTTYRTYTGSLAAHTWDAGKITTQPTCTSTGIKTYTCTVCGTTKTEKIAKTGHTYSGGKCTVCGLAESDAEDSNDESSDEQKTEETGKTEKTGKIAVTRLYNPYSGEHLLATSQEEIAILTGSGWSVDGIMCNMPTSGTPIYRLYNPYSGEHLYTMVMSEINNLKSAGWNVDGIMCYSASKESGSPIYRLYNSGAPEISSHLLSTSQAEMDSLTAQGGWKIEGVALYAAK